MPPVRSARVLIATGCVLAWLGVAYTAEKSAASMADAATKFLASLTPEQRQQAAFAFDSDERLKWHFIPTEMFPRNGLIVGEMTEPQRKLAHGLLQSGLSQRGYMTATAIMELETVLNAIEARRGGGSGRPRRQGDGARPGALLLLGLRHALGARRVGLARGRPPRLAALHRRQRHASWPRHPRSSGRIRPRSARDREGLGILATQEDSARALLMALDAGQRKQAVIDAAAPNDISTMNALTSSRSRRAASASTA